jgi:ADP-heptose:LPS heptosyltransferase
MNLMIRNYGALGDTVWLIPALNVLRREYDRIGMIGRENIKMVLAGSGLVDQFIVPPKQFKKVRTEAEQFVYRKWLAANVGVPYHHRTETDGLIPGRYVFHRSDKNYDQSILWKRDRNAGINYFDETSKGLKVYDESDNLVRDGVPEAVGKRPYVKFTKPEKKWLFGFRRDMGIPEDAFLLGWQFSSASSTKWYPYFKEVIQDSILANHPDVWVVGTGDIENLLETRHIERFINLGDTLSFRETWLLVFGFDCFVSPDTGIFNASQAFKHVPKILLATPTDGTQVCCGDETMIIRPTCRCYPCFSVVGKCHMRIGNRKRYGSLCMSSIKPKRVIQAIEEVIANAV